jgi:hypothetical protein
MDTFTVPLRSSWWLRLLGHHPLVRGSDRLEAIVVALVAVAVVLVTPVAGAVGTAVHERRVTVYEQQVATQHEVSAVVTADSMPLLDPYAVGALTPLRWTIDGVVHTDAVRSSATLKQGGRMSIRVDDHGALVQEPPGPWQPVVDAVCAALSTWLGGVVVAVTLLLVVRARLDKRRRAEWERELEDLGADGRSRSNRW